MAYHSGQDSQNILHHSVKCPCRGTYCGVALKSLISAEESDPPSVSTLHRRERQQLVGHLALGFSMCGPITIRSWQWERKQWGSFSSDVKAHQTNVFFTAASTKQSFSVVRTTACLAGPKIIVLCLLRRLFTPLLCWGHKSFSIA